MFPVAILLPTYNSTLYLEELLKSLSEQTFTRFTIITYDDCSTDNTVHLFDMLCSSFVFPLSELSLNSRMLVSCCLIPSFLRPRLVINLYFFVITMISGFPIKYHHKFYLNHRHCYYPCVANSFIGTPRSHSSTTLKNFRWSKHYFKSLFSVLDPRFLDFVWLLMMNYLVQFSPFLLIFAFMTNIYTALLITSGHELQF